MLLRQCLRAAAVGRDDRRQPRLSPRSREGGQQRAFDQRPCADDGVADLLGHEPFSRCDFTEAVQARGHGMFERYIAARAFTRCIWGWPPATTRSVGLARYSTHV